MGRVPPWLPGSAGGAGEIRIPWTLAQETKGGQPRPLRHLPDGRGRGAKADVPGNPVVDRNSPRTPSRDPSASARPIMVHPPVNGSIDIGLTIGET